MSKKKKKMKASLNYDNKFLADLPAKKVAPAKETLKKQMYKAAKAAGLPESYDSIDILICRPSGYTRKIMQYGHVGRMMDLSNEFDDFVGIGKVREVFKAWLKNNNLTMASVSRVLFPDKSASYLSSVLNEDHRGTYSNDFVNETFLKAKNYQANGLLRMDGKTIQETALDVSDDLSIEKESERKKVSKETQQKVVTRQGAEEKVVIVVTNYDTRKQATVNVENVRDLNEFWKSLKSIEAIDDSIGFTVISNNSHKKD